jgi:membrane fusion protein, multidrug efflux system
MRWWIAVVVAWCVGCQGSNDRRPPSDTVPVVTAAAVKKRIVEELQTTGTVEPLRSVAVVPEVAGMISHIHFSEGAAVEAGAPLFEIDPREYQADLREAEAQLAQAKARAKNEQRVAARYQALSGKEYVTKEQYEQAIAAVESANAEVQSREAAVQRARLNLARCTLVSPIRGRAGAIRVREGNIVRAGDLANPLVSLHQIMPISVRFSLVAKDFPRLLEAFRKGELYARATVGGRTFRERVTFLDNEIQRATGTLGAKADFPNHEELLWPGQFVDVVAEIGSPIELLSVPAKAVQTGQIGNFVFIVNGDQTASIRQIELHSRRDGEAFLSKGIDEGAQVVIEGHLRLGEGTKVRTAESRG